MTTATSAGQEPIYSACAAVDLIHVQFSMQRLTSLLESIHESARPQGDYENGVDIALLTGWAAEIAYELTNDLSNVMKKSVNETNN